jgi:hypothetical protein
MARPVPTTLRDKVRLVQVSVDAARGGDGRHFDFTREVAPGVRLVLSEVRGMPLAFSLWSRPEDIAELCGDSAYPATAALLAIDGQQARDAITAGHLVDLSQFTASESNPGMYYALFDHISERQVHAVLHRLVPALEPHAAAA